MINATRKQNKGHLNKSKQIVNNVNKMQQVNKRHATRTNPMTDGSAI